MDNDICSIPLTQAVVSTDAELEMPDQSCQNMAFLAPLKILFLSGYGSRPGEINPTTLRAHSHSVVEPNLPDSNFATIRYACPAGIQSPSTRCCGGVVKGWCCGDEH